MNYSNIKESDLTNLLIRINDLFMKEQENGIKCDWCGNHFNECDTRKFHDKINRVKYTVCNDCYDFRQSKIELRKILYELLRDNSISIRQLQNNGKYTLVKNCSDCKYKWWWPNPSFENCNITTCAIYKDYERCNKILDEVITNDIVKLKTVITKLTYKIKHYDASKH